MDWQPQSGELWTVVNERDELGSDLVPDYMTSVKDGGFYGWPYSYFGAHVDERVKPARPDLVATAIVPDYALGPHTASLGLVFYDGGEAPGRILRLGAGAVHDGRGPFARVRVAFVRLYRKGLIYRGRYIINWCPAAARPLRPRGQLRGNPGALYHIRYPELSGGAAWWWSRDAPRDHAGRHRGRREPRGRAACRPASARRCGFLS